MIAGGCDRETHRRRFKTKLIAMGMCGYERVIVEPSGIFDVDEFFDALYEEPLDRWYEIGNVIAVVDGGLEEKLSDQAEYLLASEAASAGCVVLSRCDEVSEEQKRAVTEHLERAIKNVRCRRTFEGEILSKDWEKLTDQDYDRLLKCGYHSTAYEKKHFSEEKFTSLYFMNLPFTAEELADRAEKIMAEPECGSVFRIKGFGKNRERQWMEVNAARGKAILRPISEGQEVLIVIGENPVKEKIEAYFAE